MSAQSTLLQQANKVVDLLDNTLTISANTASDLDAVKQIMVNRLRPLHMLDANLANKIPNPLMIQTRGDMEQFLNVVDVVLIDET